MIDVFFSGVLPIFFVVALGYGVARLPNFDPAMASALNRYLFYIAGPPLLFRFLAAVPFETFEWRVVLAYLVVEIVLYALSYGLFRRVFKRQPREALLLAMATMFTNHFFFVLPIATALFGETAAQPIVALIAVDAIFIYGVTMLILEVARGRERQASTQSEAIKAVVKSILRNPQVLTIFVALLVNASNVDIADGIELYVRFVGDSAAPCSLFALGIILAQRTPGLDLWAPVAVTLIKLIAMPVLVAFALLAFRVVDPLWTKPVMMVAGGPTGVMPFILALHYGVPTATITRAILFSAILSVGVLTILGSL